MSSKFKILDLFSVVGGFSHSLCLNKNFKRILANDKDCKFFASTYLNIDDSNIVELIDKLYTLLK